MKKSLYYAIISTVMVTGLFGCGMETKAIEDTSDKEITQEAKKEVVKKEITISAAGDCVLGTDTNFNYSTSLVAEVANVENDYKHLMKNVYNIFSEDDYTIVNLENTFTDETEKRDKGEAVAFHFKGPTDYVNILKESSIEGVSIENNHTYDYGEKGFEDTIKTLEGGNIDYCGEDNIILKELQGVKFAFLGFKTWGDSDEIRGRIKEQIEFAKGEGAKVIIPYFHWGIEREYTPTNYQVDLARYSIDCGADMVLGAHPHVMQSLENYKGKLIAYSLGNFSFGGNSNPSDKRTFILQAKFNFENDELVSTAYNVIPTRISSVEHKNDYVPTPLAEDDGEGILNKLNELSPTLNGEIKNEFWELD